MARPGIDLEPRHIEKAIQRSGLMVKEIASRFSDHPGFSMQSEAALKAIGRYRKSGRVEPRRVDALCYALKTTRDELKSESKNELGLWLYAQSDA